MTQPLLQLRGVSKAYGHAPSTVVHALNEVDLDIFRGEFVAIVGPSGGGKTTLLSMLGLLDSPTAGRYLIDGHPTMELTDREMTRLRSQQFGFVFQSFHLLGRRPVRDSVELGLHYKGVSRVERDTLATRALSTVGLASKLETRADKLSGGQQQRVAIARAIATGNRVLLADEPTGNLDRDNGLSILDLLTEAHANGTTVVVVTHSDEVAHRAQRIVRVEDGRIISDTGPARTETVAMHDPTEKQPGRPSLRDTLADALASVASRRLASAGLIVAVAIAVAFMILTIGLGSTTSAQVSEAFNAHTNRDVTVRLPDGTHPARELASAIAKVHRLAGVDDAVAMVEYGNIDVAAPAGHAQVTLQGVTGDFELATDTDVTWASRRASTLTDGTVLVGRALAQQLQLAPLAASPTVVVAGTPLTVVGLVDQSRRYPLLAGGIVTPATTAESLGVPTHASIAIKSANGAARQVGQQISAALDPFDPESLTVSAPIDPSKLRRQVEGGVQAALAGFTVLALVVAIITLANTISMSVIARMGEFGLRRAVGARGADLANLVSAEAILVGVGGGICGLTIGVLSLLAFTISQGWQPTFDLTLAPTAVVMGVLLAVISSTVGSVRAARLTPATALRA